MSTTVEKLYLFVHPLHVVNQQTQRYMQLWRQLLESERNNPHAAVNIVADAHAGTAPLIELARSILGDRCMVDALDRSDAVKIQIADDLEQTNARRGWYNQWIPYEMGMSCHARRIAAGILRQAGGRGLEVTPRTSMIAMGQQWGACTAKYPMFISRYLELEQAPWVRADLCPDAGYPYQANFRERLELDRQVQLYLFVAADGRPMAQLIEGKRAIWESPSVAVIRAGDSPLFQPDLTSPNSCIPASPTALRRCSDGALEFDVIDGNRPNNVTLFGRDVSYETFRQVLTGVTMRTLNEAPLATFNNIF